MYGPHETDEMPNTTDAVIVDPWFNFRATKYLVQHGFYDFWDWFDDSLSPLTYTHIYVLTDIF